MELKAERLVRILLTLDNAFNDKLLLLELKAFKRNHSQIHLTRLFKCHLPINKK